MQQHYFLNPFAVDGDLTPGGIPEGVDPNGYVSYAQGFTFDYQRNLQTDNQAKSIQRITVNQALNDITLALQDLQQFGSPEFIDTADNGGGAFGYGIGAIVRYSSSGVAPFGVYISTIANNTNTPGTTGWLDVVAALEAATDPSLTVSVIDVPFNLSGSGTFTAPSNCVQVILDQVRGGGGGGGGGASGDDAAGGGGGGGLASGVYDVTAGQEIAYAVGINGTGGTPGNAGTAGGTSNFGTISGGGGQPGAGAAASNISAGGAGGNATGGTVNSIGGDGLGGCSQGGLYFGGSGGGSFGSYGSTPSLLTTGTGVIGPLGSGGGGGVNGGGGGQGGPGAISGKYRLITAS